MEGDQEVGLGEEG